MSRELNQYILKEYTRLHSVMEQREFMEKVRFLMMAGEKEFSGYYSDTSLPVREFYSVADTLYSLNNLWMLSGFFLAVPSLFQNHKLIRITLHTNAAADLKAALLHPVPLYDELRHIFSAVYCSGIGFHPVNASPAACRFIDYGSVSPKILHDLKHSGKYDVLSIITGFHKIIVLFVWSVIRISLWF